MALYARSGPIGVDIPIAGLQKFLYSGVKTAWKIPDDLKYDCYDRAYKDLIDTGYTPRMPVLNTLGVLEYKGLGLNTDTSWAMSFFHVGDDIKHDWKTGTSTAQISIIFSVNLALIKSGITDHRGDEEARNDVQRLVYQYRGFELNGCSIGYENVFREYRGLLTNDKKEYLDVHPMHVFRIDTTIAFSLIDCTPTNNFSFNSKI